MATRVVTVTNPPTTGDGSCCCGGGECPCPCCSGTGYYSQYTVSIAGITDTAYCTDCATMNGTWTLTWTSGCVWQSEAPTFPGLFSCGGGEPELPAYELRCTDGVWELLALAEPAFPTKIAVWSGADLCEGGELSLDPGTDTICDTHPATVTIVPVSGSWVGCGSSPPMMSARVMGASPTPSTTATPCSHIARELGTTEIVQLGLNPSKKWLECDVQQTKNSLNIAGIVCSCTGCGPRCSFYQEETVE